MTTSTRSFIALSVPDDLKKDLSASLRHLKAQCSSDNIRWIPSTNWHLTLAFLGDQPPHRLDTLWEELIPLIKPHHSIPLSAESISRFPDAKSSIIAVLLKKNPELLLLQKAIAKTCGHHNISLDKRDFKPHITLARIRKGHRVDFMDQPMTVEDIGSKVALYNSELTPAGSIYTQLKMAALS